MGKLTWKEKIQGMKPAFVMVLVQISFAVVNIFYKLAANDGMSLKIIVVYRFLFASAFMIPLAFLLERKNQPPFSWKILVYAFLCGLFGGSLVQNLYLESLVYTSPTFASAMANLVPAVTFLLAVTFRIEKVRFRSAGGKAKLLGTVIGISGAMLLTFYKGAVMHIWATHVNLLNKTPPPPHDTPPPPNVHQQNRGLGALFALGSCFSYALWLIIQAKVGEIYPCPYSATALMCIMGSIQAILYALCSERDWSQWKLGWNIRLLTVAYSVITVVCSTFLINNYFGGSIFRRPTLQLCIGIVASGLMVTLIGWCVKKQGPLFVSVFNPLMLVCVALASSLLLDEQLHLGSVLGTTLIICGLYGVIWGKNKEAKQMEEEQQLTPMTNNSHINMMMSDGAPISNLLPTETVGDNDQPRDTSIEIMVVTASDSTTDNRDHDEHN